MDAAGHAPRIGLTLNETKTSITQARTERFDFLEYTFGPHHLRKTGRRLIWESPSKKSVSRLRQKVGAVLAPRNVQPWAEVRDHLNAVLRGWSNYFSCGDRFQVFRSVDHYVYDRVRGFLGRRHKVSSLGTSQFSDAVVFGKLGVLCLKSVAGAKPSVG